MIYLAKQTFTQIAESSGTIQNISRIFPVEVSDKAEADSGILLYPLNKFSYSGKTLFVRCIEAGGWAEIRVVPFEINVANFVSSGASSADVDLESFTPQDVADIFN